MRRNLALALPLAFLFIALGVPSNAQKGEAGDEAAEALVSVAEGAPLTVECALRVEERAEWRLDGGAVPADMRPAGEAAAPGGLTARLHAAAARAQHAGLYTCARRPAQRVRVRVLVVPGAGEQAAAPAAASAPSPAGPQDAALSLTFYDVGRTFSLNCTAPRPTDGAAYSWKKNGTAVEEVWDLRDRYKLEEGGAVFRMAVRTNEEDFGNYTCALGGEPALGWEVRGRPHAKLPHNTNVVEKQSLKITCKLIGKPYPAVAWTFSNSSEEGDNGTAVAAALGERVSVQRSEQGVEGGELLLRDAERSDAGAYTCAPAAGVPATSTLRVKDQYAALWPFLGICAEVFVLCAIILVYEKRRTKPELDDSDTDNHDQKKS